MVAVATMTRAVKAVSTYRGRDPRDFALCAFGGNGPVVGVEIARALSMRHVLVPPAPGVFSAVGLLFSGTEQEFVRTLLLRSGEIDPDAITEAYRDAGRGGLVLARRRRDRARDRRPSRGSPICATAGQAYELTVRVPEGRVDVDRADRRRSPPSTSAPTATARSTTRSTSSRSGCSRRVVGDRAVAIRLASGRAGRRGDAVTRSAYFGPDVGHARRSGDRAGGAREGVAPGADVRRRVRLDHRRPARLHAPTLDAFGSIDIDVD